MCGRYALHLRPSEVRGRLEQQNMPAESAPDDDDEKLRQSYNFAPGCHGLIYRADTTDYGTSKVPAKETSEQDDANDNSETPRKRVKLSRKSSEHSPEDSRLSPEETKYKLQGAKWGLIPFWTKRPPDYASQLRTINCRDDSLMQSGGMWNTMKQRKRCIVVVEGFYEWLKKGKDRIPYYMKRTDGQLLCLAGLWDSVTYEDQDANEKLYSYTIITTDSNKQLKFLHDRMPVVLEPGSTEMKAWLDPTNIGWTQQLQGILKPYDGTLDCYQVDKAVGNVRNNKPNFVVPIDSKDNKNNIANFFGSESSPKKSESPQKKAEDDRDTTSKIEDSESGAPLPKPKDQSESSLKSALQNSKAADGDDTEADHATKSKIKEEFPDDNDRKPTAVSPTKSGSKGGRLSKSSTPTKKTPRKTRNDTSNQNTPTKDRNQRITAFFGGK